MKKIGLIMGTSWESSKEYYQIINQMVNEKLGDFHCAEMFMINVDFQDVVNNFQNDDWDSMNKLLYNAADSLEKSGADFIVICTNALHNCADYISKKTNIPLIHIADCVGAAIKRDDLKKVGLLGTKSTMKLDYYKDRLAEYNIEVIVPGLEDMNYVDKIIFDELCKGKFMKSSKKGFLEIINRLQKIGAQGIVLGCTEIPLLIKQEDSIIPLYDTLTLHSKGIVDYALRK
ncbi:aspartate/glutamate racemase family protein [Desulfobacterales bacterium HSG17]|nr:aspartate/glutamate racemase family protein [Desulfobacterales bacterium HSG17]